MPVLETLTIALGPPLAKAIVKAWVGDPDLVADASSDVAELLNKAGLGLMERRRVSRDLDNMTERIAERLKPFFDVEYRGQSGRCSGSTGIPRCG